MRRVLERIRSRRVVQWGLSYLAGAWLVLQVTEVLADIYACWKAMNRWLGRCRRGRRRTRSTRVSLASPVD